MLLVSDLLTYRFCERKLFLEKVMKLRGPVNPPMVKGSIKHELYNKINHADYDIVSNLRQKIHKDEILLLYRRRYFNIINQIISKHLKNIYSSKLNHEDLRKELWTFLLNESKIRASYVSEAMENTNLFGEELWDSLYPKSFTELLISSDSLGLKGSIDRVELRNQDEYVPIEIKSGKPPTRGVWPDHKIQVAAYSLLLENEYKKPVTFGYVNYIDSQLQRHVEIDDSSKKKVKEIMQAVEKLLHSDALPKIIDDKKRCDACNLKEKCYAIKETKLSS